jgi:UDP:flavonoid glycosyltransferase YjiC (YdhE family)
MVPGEAGRAGSGSTIVLFPEAAYGPALNCVGIAQELERTGHRPVFVMDASFTGLFAGYGFEEHPVQMSPPVEEEVPGQFWKDFIAAALPSFRGSSYDQLESYVLPVWDAIVDSSVYVDDELAEVLARIRPDLVCIDNVILFPAATQAGCPWVRIVSCNENEIRDPNIPPNLSGLPANDRRGWDGFEARFRELAAPLSERFNAFITARGHDPYTVGIFFEPSPYLNLLLYPRALAYPRANPLDPARFQYLEGCVRQERGFELPRFEAGGHGPLVYVSLGSLGCADLELMNRLLALLGRMPLRVLANVGDYEESYPDPPPNVVLSSFFPQPSVIAQCDVVIHHGGNNTFTEALYFGKPALVLPMCWDGHDNATRIEETGYGMRLPTYTFSDADFEAAIERLLGDREMHARLNALSGHMQAQQGAQRAAHLLGALAAEAPARSAR